MIKRVKDGPVVEMGVEFVRPVSNADMVAIGLKHESEPERVIAVALSRRSAATVMVHLMDCLRQDDLKPNETRPLQKDKETGAKTSLAVREIKLEADGAEAYLILTTEDGLEIPFSFPAENVGAIASMLTVAALKAEDHQKPASQKH